MALSVTGLRDRIVGKLDAAFPVPEGAPNVDPDVRRDAARAIAEAVIEEIQANAEVTGIAMGTCPPGTGGGPLAGGSIANGRVG